MVGTGIAQPKPLRIIAQRSSTSPHRIVSTASAGIDTVRVLAVMVDFLRDQDNRTSGNGNFLLQPDESWLLDPPPHDARYFRSKLQFVHNYFRKVSGGRLTVTGDVLDSVVTLQRPMSDYSPPTVGDDMRKLANLAADAWHKTDSLYPQIDFRQYDAFVLFHAGAGRDIDLVSILGYNPTPYDLPSLFVDSAAFAKALSDPGFNGIAVDSGRTRILNTIILPETESRVLGSGRDADTLRLGINGLFASSIGSFLGLPDLFDTRTGRSGIGQFGLMDGASIFAFAGVFPPEPSAWEKIALGWVNPITTAQDMGKLACPAVGLHTFGVDTVYRVPVSGAEYFLVENRNRDVHRDGATVTFIRAGGQLDSLHVEKDTVGFNLADVRLIRGSVIDLDEFDWALPGTIDSTGRFDGGGILIWHIDERLVNDGRQSNTVNADPSRRGVNLKEADGSQDIGQSYGQFDPGSGTEYGSPLDCWFQGNVAPAYLNRFDAFSRPSSRSNSGALSLVTIKDFSPRSPRMTFNVAFGNERLTPLPGFPKQIRGIVDGPIPLDLDGDGTQELVVARNTTDTPIRRGQIMAWRQDGQRTLSNGDSSGLAAETDSLLIPKSLVLTRNSGSSWCAVLSDAVYLWRTEDVNADGFFDLVRKIPWTGTPSAGLMFVDSTLVVAGQDSIAMYDLRGVQLNHISGKLFDPVGGFCRLGAGSLIATARTDSLFLVDVRAGTVLARVGVGSQIAGLASGDVAGNGSAAAVVATSAGSLVVLDATGTLLSRSEHSSVRWASGPALADLNHDGRQEILLASGSALHAYSAQGVLMDGFPLESASAISAANGATVAVDLIGEGYPAVISGSANGDIQLWQPSARRYIATSVSVGGTAVRSLSCFAHETAGGATIGLAAADDSGWIVANDLNSAFTSGRFFWPMRGFSPEGSSASTVQTVNPVPLAQGFLPSDRVYNWPNPVYGASTQIRYMCSSDAEVRVKIFDLAGATVADLRGHAYAGADGEITWDVKGIQSGVYLARVEATSGERSEAVVIKIAVVK